MGRSREQHIGNRGQSSRLALTPYVALTLLLFTSISAQAAGAPAEPTAKPAGLLSQITARFSLGGAAASPDSLGAIPASGIGTLGWQLELAAIPLELQVSAHLPQPSLRPPLTLSAVCRRPFSPASPRAP